MIDLQDAEAARLQLLLVDLDLNLAYEAAHHGDLRDAAGAFESLLELVFGQALQGAQITVAADGEQQDRLRVGVEFADSRVFDVGWQLAADRRNLAFDVDRAVAGGFVGEEDDHRRDALDGGRLDVVDVVDAGDRVLDALGHQGVDGFGAGARIGRRDHHDRKVEGRQQIDAQLGPGDQPDDEQRADHHEHEQRPPDGDVCQGHSVGSLRLRARSARERYACFDLRRDDVALRQIVEAARRYHWKSRSRDRFADLA